jgi:hypothetical protein
MTDPISKLIEGFCSPHTKAPILNDDDHMDSINNQYAADLSPQKPTAKQNQEKKEVNITTESSTSDPVTTSTVDKPITTTTETETTDNGTDQESLPEDVSKKVIANRRKRGFENFIMACIFVLATLLSLKKLGYTTSDFGFSASGGGDGSSSWIQVVDKASIEDEVEEEPVGAVESSIEDEVEEEPVGAVESSIEDEVEEEPVDAIDEASPEETDIIEDDEDDNDDEATDSSTEEAVDEL